MANYTDDEVNAAVSKIVRTNVRSPTGILGERQVETSFNDMQEAAAGVYILYFNAPYYTLLLGTTRLADSLATQASTIASLIDAVTSVKRNVTPISDLTTLANAKAALDELSSAVSSRDQGFQDIQAVPAFRRYAANIDQFIAATSSNIKGTSTSPGLTSSSLPSSTSSLTAAPAIVDTPAGARSKIPALVSQLKTQQDELVRRATLFTGALADFAALNLPQLAAQSVISNAASVLNDHLVTLSALDENTRLESLRAVTLDLLTQRPLVETYGAGLSPSEFITTSGTARAYSDSLHLATPAGVLSSKSDPYNVVDTAHFLQVTVDGGAPFEYPLPLGFVAELNATLVEPYALDSSSNSLTIQVSTDSSSFTAPVSLGTGTKTADDIITAVNAALGGEPVRMEKVFLPLKVDTLFAMTSLGGHNAHFAVIAGGLAGLNVLVGDQVDVLTGPNLGTTWTVTAAGDFGLTVTGSVAIIPVSLPGDEVQVGPALRALRLRDTDPASSLALRRTIALPATGGASDKAAALLGFAAGISARSRPVLANELAANVTGSTSLFAAQAVDVSEFVESGHSSVADPSLVVLARGQFNGSITGGLTVVFTSTDLLLPQLEVGDKAVVRETVTSADVNAEGVITAIDLVADTIDITFSDAITAGSVAIEVGVAFTFGFGGVFTILGGPNQGRYTARENQGIGTTCSFEVLFDRPLPVPKTGSTVVSFDIIYSKSHVRFSSQLKSVTSSVAVNNGAVGHAGEYFFEASELPASAIGSTNYLQFDTFPAAAAVGDLVELYENQYNIVSREYSIEGVDANNRILKLVAISADVDDLASDFSITFDSGVPNPFGKIRISQTANYVDFKAALDAWLLRPELTTLYYRDLARFLNPVLVNDNPTSAEVDNAVNQLKKLSAILTEAGARAYGTLHTPTVVAADTLEFALDEYTSPVEPAVDVLVTTFRNKGADRAIDLLLEGQFSTFFGLNLNTVSYSGALTASARDLAMNDLPIRKLNRRDVGTQQLIGTITDEPNYEFDTSDADDPNTPDIPGSPDV